MENTNKYLGESKISKLLIKFSIPCVVGLLIIALYNIVDQIFIGNSELGILGNAATGVSFPVICIANAFAWYIGDGAASYLSICAGRKDTESSHKCVGTGIVVTTLISIVLLIIGEVFATPLMNLFGSSSNTIDMVIKYFRIVVAFFPFYLLLNVMTSMIMSDGQPTEEEYIVYNAAQRCTDAVNNEGIKLLPIGIGEFARLDILDMFSPKVKAKCIDNMDVFIKLFEMLSSSICNTDDTVFD